MFKLTKINKKTIEHLLYVNYKIVEDYNINDLVDSPYVLIDDVKNILPCYSNSQFESFKGKLINEHKLLNSTNKLVIKKTKKTHNEKSVLKLVESLNSSIISRINGYVVTWFFEEDKYDKNRFHLFPISQYSSGNITILHMEFIIDFAKKNNLNITFGYYDYNSEKTKYGTLTPSIKIW